MEPSNHNPNTSMLQALQQKQQEIITEVENLESKLSYITNKPALSLTLCKNLSKCSELLKDLQKTSVLPVNSAKKLTVISENIQEQVSLITKHLNFSLESAAIPKLIQLFKLQVSINTFTRNFYETKIEAISNSKTMETSLKSDKKDKAAELAQSLSLIQNQNKEFTAAVNKNISQLELLIEPAIEKTLNLFVILQQKPSHQLSPEFVTEKSEIEESFQGVSKYLHQFSELFSEFCASRQDFGTFSEISINESSVYQLELEEIEENNHFSSEKLRFSKEYINDLRIIDEIVKVADSDAECQKQCLQRLLKIMESLETENKQWEILSKSAQKINQSEQIKFLFKLINDFFKLLKESITNKDTTISTLEKIREAAAHHFKGVKNQDSSLFNTNDKRSYLFMDSTKLNSSSTRYKEEKRDSRFLEISSPNCVQEFSNSSDSDKQSFRIEEDSLENPEKLMNDLRAAQAQVRNFQETIVELRGKDEKSQRLLEEAFNSRPNSMNAPVLSFLPAFLQVSREFYKLKEKTEEDLKEFSGFVGRMIGEAVKTVKMSVQGMGQQIGELKDLNGALVYEKDVLKDTFHNEVKKMMNELQEVKKMNKDLKDSLIKLSNKYESQNKLNNELLAGLGLTVNEPISVIKQVLSTQQNFIAKMQTASGIKDLETIATTLCLQKSEKSCPKPQIFSVIPQVFNAFDKNLSKISFTFLNFFDKYHLKIEKCQQLLDIFKKFNEKDMSDCSQEIESKNTPSYVNNSKIEELERANMKFKNLERELQFVISTKNLELQESKENFTTLQEFTDNCIRVIEEFKNLYSGKEDFKGIEPAVDEILTLYKEVL